MNHTEFIDNWNQAKHLFNKDFSELEKAIKIFELLISYDSLDKIIVDSSNFNNESEYLSEIHYNKALLFGDYSAALCFAGHFDKAINASNKALFYKNNCNYGLEFSLQYILLNRGTIHLFKKEYQESIKWLDKILYNQEVDKIFIKHLLSSCHTYKGISLFFLEEFDESEKELLKAKEMINNYKEFEPFFFLKKIYEIKGNHKLATKYRKMLLTRIRKLKASWIIDNMQFYPIDFNDLE